MNQHYYIGIITLLFYFVLLQFKKDIKNGSKKNFIYILFIPLVFYVYLSLFADTQSLPILQTVTPTQISENSSELMSNMYPLSSEL